MAPSIFPTLKVPTKVNSTLPENPELSGLRLLLNISASVITFTSSTGGACFFVATFAILFLGVFFLSNFTLEFSFLGLEVKSLLP